MKTTQECLKSILDEYINYKVKNGITRIPTTLTIVDENALSPMGLETLKDRDKIYHSDLKDQNIVRVSTIIIFRATTEGIKQYPHLRKFQQSILKFRW